MRSVMEERIGRSGLTLDPGAATADTAGMRRFAPLALVFLALPALGAPVAVTNPSFEADPAGAGTFPALVPQGWTLFDPAAIVEQVSDAVGVVNSDDGAPFFPGGVPDGSNAALIFLSGDVGGGEVGLQQTLAATLAADTTYTLTVQVGNIASGTGFPPFDVYGFFDLDGFPGYRVELFAGETVIASDDDSLAPTLAEGTFAASVVSVTIPAGHPQIGAPLRIRLTNKNLPGTPQEPGIEVDFDAVSLDAPEPAAALQLLAGALALALGRKRVSP
jgi:hapalindole H/12-epi-hapalindole U/12-epi-fischerindole U synthase